MNSKLYSLIILLAIVVAIISIGDMSIPAIYARETADWRAQGIGQDLFDLVAVVPALIISALLFRRGSKTAYFILGGSLAFLIYTFIIFVFGVHFNSFFLLYCLGLALSSYSFIWLLRQYSAATVKEWFTSTIPIRVSITYLWVFALLFAFLWLSEILPATIQGTVPAAMLSTGLWTNPVHVIDLSFVLPGFCMTALLLRKRHSLGYVFAPIIMTFSVVMTFSIGTLVVYEYTQGLVENYYVAIVMVCFGLLSLLVFRNVIKYLKVA